MSIDLVCPSCGRLLRVAAEHAGKQIRCPACQQISISPANPASALPESGGGESEPRSQSPQTDSNATFWHVRTPEGAVYGPIRWDVVLAWAEEGRIADDCELGNSAEGPWQPATNLIPGLGSSVLSGSSVFSGSSVLSGNSVFSGSSVLSGGATNAGGGAAVDGMHPPQHPFGSGQSPFAGPTAGLVAPHRGLLVLMMGILGFFFGCPVFGVVAWLLGSRDLREMREGRMDRTGETMTQVGMILGMVLSILWLAGTFIALTIFLVAVGLQF